jgi:tetratricopeptide (TPR) repeat protein
MGHREIWAIGEGRPFKSATPAHGGELGRDATVGVASSQKWISLISLISLLICSPSFSLVSHAQMELGVMQGTVVDEAGKPLEGVTLRLKNIERGREVELKSDKSGKFYRRGLQAVEYEMSVEKEGYQPIKDKVKLVAGTDRRFDFKLAKATPAGAEEFGTGVAAYNKGDYEAAAKAFEAAVQKAPTVPDLHVNLALAYFRLKRTPEAVAELEKAASLGPDDAKIQFQLGSAYVEMQSYDKAIEAFEKGLAKNANLGDPLALEAAATLGAVYFAKGDNDKASAQFQKVLAAKPAHPGATLGMGKVHFSKGEVDQAMKLFEQVVASAPGTPEAAQADAFLKELRKTKGPAGDEAP